MDENICKVEVLIYPEQSSRKILVMVNTNSLHKKRIIKPIVSLKVGRHIVKLLQKGRKKISKNIMTTTNVKYFEKKCINDTEALVDLVDAANYLIQLYYKIGEKYSCSITKLGKLLSIAAFICAKNGVKLFEDDIVTYNCGTGFAKLGYHYLSDVIVDGKADCETTISRNDICDSVAYPQIYVCENDIPRNIQNLLLDVFLTYGAYPAKTLGKLIDIFKEKISTAASTIDLNKIYLHSEVVIAQSTKNNPLGDEFCNYIKNYLWD